MKQIAGGVLLLIAGISTGEVGSVDLPSVSLSSAIAFLYLIVFGSLVGFSAYLWLLQVSTPARVSTYAYVNPVIAVFLGWLLGGEQPTALTLLGSVVILLAVAIVTTARAESPPADRPVQPPLAVDSEDGSAEAPVPAAADTR
jgi:drug/metabolite transporter (DMT)-like permease